MGIRYLRGVVERALRAAGAGSRSEAALLCPDPPQNPELGTSTPVSPLSLPLIHCLGGGRSKHPAVSGLKDLGEQLFSCMSAQHHPGELWHPRGLAMGACAQWWSPGDFWRGCAEFHSRSIPWSMWVFCCCWTPICQGIGELWGPSPQYLQGYWCVFLSVSSLLCSVGSSRLRQHRK